MRRHRCGLAGGRATAFLLLLLVGAGIAHAQEADLVSLQADPAQWVMPNGNYAAWNYSPLDQITVENVEELAVAWTLPLPILDSHQAAPLVVGDTMYVVTPKPNHVYALDLARDGVIRWEFRAELEDLELVTERACCGAQTRGLAYAGGKLYFNTLDGQAVALDAATGEMLWRDDPTDYPVSEVRTGAPLVAGRNVIFGVSGGDRGVRGHVTAYDIDTGEVRWRYHNLGPDEDVGIGPRFRPFYADDRIPNPALDSWFGDSWRLGGGAVWGWFSHDPELNYVYYGTGNCGPWNPDYRREWGVIELDEHGGVAAYRNNYCASVLARDATTGELAWAYNVTPQDQWDLDEVSAGVLVDPGAGGPDAARDDPRLAQRLLLRPRPRDGRAAGRALGLRPQRLHARRRHGDRSGALRHREDQLHRPGGPAALPAGRREHRRRLVPGHLGAELAERRVLAADGAALQRDVEPLRRHAGRRGGVRAGGALQPARERGAAGALAAGRSHRRAAGQRSGLGPDGLARGVADRQQTRR